MPQQRRLNCLLCSNEFDRSISLLIGSIHYLPQHSIFRHVCSHANHAQLGEVSYLPSSSTLVRSWLTRTFKEIIVTTTNASMCAAYHHTVHCTALYHSTLLPPIPRLVSLP